MPKKSGSKLPVHVYVEYYRAKASDVRDLKRYLEQYEAVTGIGKVARKASGAGEVGDLFTVYVLPVIARYAGNKVLQIIEDRVKEWWSRRRHRDEFIVLNLSGQKRRRKIGKGRPKRYYF